MPTSRKPLLAAALLAACAHAPPAPTLSRTAIAGVVARTTRRTVGDDLAHITGARSSWSDPEHLEAVAGYMAAEFARAGFAVTRQPVRFRGALAHNVIAERAGDDPARVVLASAHYDTVPGSPGADDNGTGLAVLLATARAVGAVRTRASVRLVAFAFEEDQMVGSDAYVAALSAVERRRIRAAINFDMVGYHTDAPGSQRFPDEIALAADGRAVPTRGDFIGVAGLIEHPEPVDALLAARAYEPFLRVYVLGVPDFLRSIAPDIERGDHRSFWRAGIPCAGVSDTGDFRNPHYHTASDTLEHVDLRFASRVARWGAAAVLLLASSPPG